MAAEALPTKLPEGVRAVSPTFRPDRLAEIFAEAKPFAAGHFLYPDDEKGSHLESLMVMEPVSRVPRFLQWITEDVATWVERAAPGFDLFFAPAHPATQALAEALARRLGKRTAYWEYLPTGRFGARLVSGSLKPGERAVVLNGVSMQGRCVGNRLPGFVAAVGGKVAGACVFAKGTASMVRETEARWGEKFYSAVQVDVKVHAALGCPVCARTGAPPRSWRSYAP